MSFVSVFEGVYGFCCFGILVHAETAWEQARGLLYWKKSFFPLVVSNVEHRKGVILLIWSHMVS